MGITLGFDWVIVYGVKFNLRNFPDFHWDLVVSGTLLYSSAPSYSLAQCYLICLHNLSEDLSPVK